MAHLLRLRTKAPPRTKRSKGQKHKHNGVAGRVGNGSQPAVRPSSSEAIESVDWEIYQEVLEEQTIEFFTTDKAFDESFEEIGYGGYMRRRLPSADEQE